MKRLPLATLAVALLLSACTGGDQDPGPSGPSSAAPSASASKELTVVVHESFSLPDDLKAAFEEQTGYRVTYLTQDASIALVNQLVLTKDAPLGDAVYGIEHHQDNVTAINGAQRTDDAITFYRHLDLGFTPHSCRIYQYERILTFLKMRVDCIARRTGDIADDNAIFTKDRIDKR